MDGQRGFITKGIIPSYSILIIDMKKEEELLEKLQELEYASEEYYAVRDELRDLADKFAEDHDVEVLFCEGDEDREFTETFDLDGEEITEYLLENDQEVTTLDGAACFIIDDYLAGSEDYLEYYPDWTIDVIKKGE